MKWRCPAAVLVSGWVFCLLFSAASEVRSEDKDARLVLWQIGQKDGNTREFALAPNRFNEYQEDPIFLVGVSKPEQDWPYVQPGPADVWAGARPHTASILFGLESAPEKDCELVISLANTHYRSPPELEISVNGHGVASEKLPAGGPDATIHGDLREAWPHEFRVSIPASVLKSGNNIITILSKQGSWVLYDAVSFLAYPEVRLTSLTSATVVRACQAIPALVHSQGRLHQAVELIIVRAGEPVLAEVLCDNQVCWSGKIDQGSQEIMVPVPRVTTPEEITVEVRAEKETIYESKILLEPVREWIVYLLPHSHVDIGFTNLQTKIEQEHWQFYEQALEIAGKTADYPPESRFKWNVEVLWAVDSYLRSASPEKREHFIAGVRNGVIGLQALYGNELTALCRPEELLRLHDYAKRLEDEIGVTIDSAMISDVPGYSWGIVTALAHAGVRYFSIGPNGGHRIGHTLRVWGDKAFWWKSPSGKERVLCWIPRTGYWRGFRGKAELFNYLRAIEREGYPFDVVQLRHCLGDNAGPDVSISDFVKAWNEKYAYPRLVIATCSQMMQEFEKRYGESLPEVAGDFTPYWEDGAASSARETAMVRRAADRLSTAEALWCMLLPGAYPDDLFYQAWRNVILYDEHTWGAFNSITEPDSEFAQSQWAIKQSFALEADRQSRELLDRAVAKWRAASGPDHKDRFVMVFNPCGWPRSDLVTFELPPQTSLVEIRDLSGKTQPWQMLSDGSIVFFAENVPAFGGRRYALVLENRPAAPQADENLRNVSTTETAPILESRRYSLEVDPSTGGVRRLLDKFLNRDMVDPQKGWALAEYLYVAGRDPANVQRVTGPAVVKKLDQGPVMQRWLVEARAPGSRNVHWLYELSDVVDRIKVDVVIDKEKVRSPEAVHIAFPFAVPQGEIRMELAWAIIRPEIDQLPGACKNYFTVQRWVDVSNEEYGVLWASWDAPLVQLGAIRTDVPQPFSLDGWLTHIEPTQTILSYVMNNYWETNYKADQEGPTLFTYFILPHQGPYDSLAATRFGLETTRPMVAVLADERAPELLQAPFAVLSPRVVAMECKMARDQRGLIVRLFNPQETSDEVEVLLDQSKLSKISLTDLSERPLTPITGPITVPGFGLVSLRLE